VLYLIDIISQTFNKGHVTVLCVDSATKELMYKCIVGPLQPFDIVYKGVPSIRSRVQISQIRITQVQESKEITRIGNGNDN